ncbi:MULTISPECIES: AbrB/MazE/SpoVT family DNA-binding domain-containing protein [Pyrobaculum]|uniref:AbrB/MazE/SpoVT family DNA-binding domain-containing protein n=2 Tax=Pyrobaculum arsenaticum TaxID=121277 RepID=A4WHY6_PYRAR|nr:AbrB/MazE/SpoVT family DNA-binding domain-containing protein [Pyrobaculum arsenaticum]ABP50003.1 hypothetical protein Pars_0402 [Pyrobaculum arsenaticum DSM 13514]MCY0890235.1 AbrB/MazE/SpoVT family DNA-binding domain-containing protein [Pyrobaculum arsenaticum]NYR15028.1 AbrB/MazE/SpoVT family DNA-binding domain-containing protein [Pyrobaculum arsenaticum]
MSGSLGVGKRGCIVPEQIREAFGIDEGDEVIVEIETVLKPAGREDAEKRREKLRAHSERLAGGVEARQACVAPR